MRSLARRTLAFGSLLSFAMIAVVLLWADRGSALGTESLYTIVDGLRSVEHTANINLINRSDIPGTTDQVGHAMLWSVGTLIIGLSLFRRLGAASAATVALLLSLAFEVGQPFLSASRTTQPGDIVANAVGVVIGFCGLIILHSACSLIRAER